MIPLRTGSQVPQYLGDVPAVIGRRPFEIDSVEVLDKGLETLLRGLSARSTFFGSFIGLLFTCDPVHSQSRRCWRCSSHQRIWTPWARRKPTRQQDAQIHSDHTACPASWISVPTIRGILGHALHGLVARGREAIH